MSFDPFTATWTKFLHSDPSCISTRNALATLLSVSEIELAKLLSVNGNPIPFQGAMMQSLTLRRGERRESSTGNSMQSESIFVATPGSILPGDARDEIVDREHPVEVADPIESLGDRAPVEEAVVEEVFEKPLAQEPISVSKGPQPLSFEPEPVSQEADEWGGWGRHKKDTKKEKLSVTFDDIQPAEVYPTDTPAEIPPNYGTPEPVPEPVDDLGWSSFSTTPKKKKKKNVPIIEEAEIPAPEPVEEPVDNLDWSSFPITSKKKKKKSIPMIEEAEIPAPEPRKEPVDDLDWSSSWTTSKKKKSISSTEEEHPSPPEVEPVVDPVNDSEEPKLDDASPLLPESPRIEDGVWETPRSEASLPLESVGHPTSIVSLLAAFSTDTTTDTLQLQDTQSRRTVVLTIHFPDHTSDKPQHVMTTIADDTRSAIIETVNSYLDSKSKVNGKQGQRRIEMTYGVGRNGDVDLSSIDDTMWPEYLDYFRQYTRIPELTVAVLD